MLDQSHVPSLRVQRDNHDCPRRRCLETLGKLGKLKILQRRLPPVANNPETHYAQKHDRKRPEGFKSAARRPQHRPGEGKRRKKPIANAGHLCKEFPS